MVPISLPQSIADEVSAVDDFELSSGLQGTRSDIVGLFELDVNKRLTSTTRLRYDDNESTLRRIESSLRYTGDRFSLTGNYFRLDDITQTDEDATNEEFRGVARVALNDNWSLTGGLTYDFDADNLRRQSYGLIYKDECTRLSFQYGIRNANNDAIRNTSSFSFTFALLSLGNFRTTQ